MFWESGERACDFKSPGMGSEEPQEEGPACLPVMSSGWPSVSVLCRQATSRWRGPSTRRSLQRCPSPELSWNRTARKSRTGGDYGMVTPPGSEAQLSCGPWLRWGGKGPCMADGRMRLQRVYSALHHNTPGHSSSPQDEKPTRSGRGMFLPGKKYLL